MVTSFKRVVLILLLQLVHNAWSFSYHQGKTSTSTTSPTELSMGLFDKFIAGGSGKDRLDEEWEKQQDILKLRRAPKKERDTYFRKVSNK